MIMEIEHRHALVNIFHVCSQLLKLKHIFKNSLYSETDAFNKKQSNSDTQKQFGLSTSRDHFHIHNTLICCSFTAAKSVE